MKLSELIGSADVKSRNGHDVAVGGLAYDSRLVKPGYAFVAIPGRRTDGHEFIKEAVARGAAAVIVEKLQADLDENISQVMVADARLALAQTANRFYGRPSEKLRLIGVTGTNGKTTTSYLLESIFQKAGFKTGLIGTIEYRIGGASRTAERTTPESLDLQRLFASMVDKGVGVAVMEVSSHALHLKRIDGCSFAARIFMNLSQDHLDFHNDLEAYFLAKARLFGDKNFGSGLKLVNADDSYGRRIASMSDDKVVTFGLKSADYRPVDVELSAKGTSFSLVGPGGSFAVRSRLLGAFNLTNLMAAAAAARELGVEGPDIAAGLLSMDHVPGRFETVACGQDFQVLIDYAHTPDGLEKVLSAARNLARGHRLITVFGCGGDRDRSKRPKMGAIAARLSDVAIVTSDNPRSESPQAIIDDILRGIPKGSPARSNVVVERGRAIKTALSEARAGDVVVIAGKGHENYQILNDKVVPFDDRRIASEAIREILSDTN